MRGLLFALATLICGPAYADWQYTRWGMSPDQVIAASGGKARVATADEASRYARLAGMTARAIGDYQTEEMRFSVEFHHDTTGALQLVALTLRDWSGNNRLREALLARYGRPVESDKLSMGESDLWRDGAGGNIVRAYRLPGLKSMSILYSPLARGSGL